MSRSGFSANQSSLSASQGDATLPGDSSQQTSVVQANSPNISTIPGESSSGSVTVLEPRDKRQCIASAPATEVEHGVAGSAFDVPCVDMAADDSSIGSKSRGTGTNSEDDRLRLF
jgi:hypothetical protein